MIVPDKFNMVDMEGIDLLRMQGIPVEGLYDKLVESITLCRYQCLYNWKFNDILIPPTYVEMEVGENEEVIVNFGITVTTDDVIHLQTIEPGPSEPVIIPLLAEENMVYNAPSGVDGFDPVTVDVPSYTPVIESLSVTENGTYNPPSGVDGYSPVSVDVPEGGASTDYVKGQALIPVMTTNTTPSGVASASSYIGNNFEAFRAFNGVEALSSMQQGWLAAASDNAPYIQYAWDSLKTFGKLVIYTANNSTTVSRTVTVEGLTQNDVWENCLESGSTVVLDFVNGTYGDTCTKYEISLNGGSYKAIKITGNEKFYGGPNQYACTFSEVQVYEDGAGVLPGLGYYGESDPVNSFGENGNIFVNMDTGIIYQKQNGIWTQI